MRQLMLICAATFALTGCERNPDPAVTQTVPVESSAAQPAGEPPAAGEMDWARAALERNPGIEVLAVDGASRVFTLLDRTSGDVQAVKLEDLAAMPVASIVTNPAAGIASDDDTAAAAVVGSADPDAGAGALPYGGSPDTPVSSDTVDYKVERSGDQVRVSGPGVSIVSAGGAATAAAERDSGRSTVDPIICDGPRVLHLNDRRIFVDGDAITARGGCELHIINSRIAASGRGVVIRDAVVHITNSEIEGAAGSFDAGAGARVILQGATLKGAMRRDERAEVQELGANQWK